MYHNEIESVDKNWYETDIIMLQLQYNCKHTTVFDAIICIESLKEVKDIRDSQNVSENTENL